MVARRTGFNAEADVAELLRKSGSPGALAEISQLPTDHVRSVFFMEFLRQARPSGGLLMQMLKQASNDISSSYELGQLLIKTGTTLSMNTEEWSAYSTAVNSMSSDWERRRVLSAVVDVTSSTADLARVIELSKTIGSSFERRSLLTYIVSRHAVDGAARAAYLDAANQISSNLERTSALDALNGGRR
jgi:hypothetical protein